MRVSRWMVTAAAAAVTGGLVLGGAVQAMAATVQSYVVFDVAGVGDFSSTLPCTGVLETSANGDKTWHVVSATLAAIASHKPGAVQTLSLIHISEPTRLG